MSQGLTLTLLGEVSVTHNGSPLVGFISNKAQALLCYLAITGRTHTRSELANLLWGDMPEAEARANLRVVLANLRRLVDAYMTIDRQTVRFNQQCSYYLDVADFRLGIQQSRSIESEEHAQSLGGAVETYRGDLMQGFYVRNAPVFEEWLLGQRERLRQQAVQSLSTLATHHASRGEYQLAIAYTSRLLTIESWHEEAHRQLMFLLNLSGQRSAALAQYEICRRVLTDELGIEPDKETNRLYQCIREGTRYESGIHQTHHSFAHNDKHILLPFVGRGNEYAWLLQQWEVAQRCQGAWTLVAGAAGTGKTRLVEEILRYAVGAGAMLLRGKSKAFERAMPYQPFIEILRTLFRSDPSAYDSLAEIWLGELSQMLPELHEHYPHLRQSPSGSTDMARQRLFEAITRLLEAFVTKHPSVVLFLDDIQHADPATIDLLRYLLDRLRHTKLWWVGAYRSDEIDEHHPILRLRHDLQREQRAVCKDLWPLDTQALVQLMDNFPGLDDDQTQQLIRYVQQRTAGNPCRLTQVFQSLEQRNILRITEHGLALDDQRLHDEDVDLSTSQPAAIKRRVKRKFMRPYAMSRTTLGRSQKLPPH